MILFSRDKNSISVISAEALKKRVADMVVKLRKEHGLSQSDMAERFQMSQVAYAKIENCKTDINLEKIFLFCEIFQITLTELLGLDEVISSSAHRLISDQEAEIIRLKNDLSEKSMMIKLLSDKVELLTRGK